MDTARTSISGREDGQALFSDIAAMVYGNSMKSSSGKSVNISNVVILRNRRNLFI